jgi:hypothetical protein
MEKQIDPNAAIDFIIKHGNEYAVAKAERVYIEQYLKVVKATLMNDCVNMPATKSEAYALAHPDFKLQIDGLKVAVEKEETLKWHLEAARLRVEVWRSQEASNRGQDKVTR